ncbi:MAG: FeoB-associated Cys-rich membrane protein [Thermodesulfobacteriota bacterium]
MLENILIAIIVAAAAFFVGRRFRNSFTGKKAGGCGCGCSGCDPKEGAGPSGCDQTPADFPRRADD